MTKLKTCSIDNIHAFEAKVFHPYPNHTPTVGARIGLRVGNKPVAEVNIENLQDYPEVVEAAQILLTHVEKVAASVVGDPEDEPSTAKTPPKGLVDQQEI